MAKQTFQSFFAYLLFQMGGDQNPKGIETAAPPLSVLDEDGVHGYLQENF